VSDIPGAMEAVEALRQLRDVVRDFAEREAELVNALEAHRYHQRRQRDAAAEELAREFAAKLAGAEAARQTDLQAVGAGHQRRRTRIEQAHRAGVEQALRLVRENAGQRKYELQKQQLQATRQRDAEQLANDQILAALRRAHDDLLKLEEETGRVFRSRRDFAHAQAAAGELDGDDTKAERAGVVSELGELLKQAREDLTAFRQLPLPRWFGKYGPWFAVSLLPLPLAWWLEQSGGRAFPLIAGVGATTGLLLTFMVLRLVAGSQIRPAACRIGTALGRARALHDLVFGDVETRHREERERIERAFEARMLDLNQQWRQTEEDAAVHSASVRQQLDARLRRAGETCERLHQRRLQTLARTHDEHAAALRAEEESRRAALAARCEQAIAAFTVEHEAALNALASEWRERLQPVTQSLNSITHKAAELCPAWGDPTWRDWRPPEAFGRAARFGSLQVEPAALCETLPRDARLALPWPAAFEVPMLLTFPDHGSLLLETLHSGRAEAIAALNALVLRLLAVSPPGRARFTFIDPVGLGQSFSGLMHLADFDEGLINSRIWTQPGQIEERLAAINEHMEKVIQVYLRNEHRTIDDYNARAGNLAEPRHFVVVADFPAGFSDTATRRLAGVVASGARCGVHLLLHWDRKLTTPHGFSPEELRQSSVRVDATGALGGRALAGAKVVLDAPPDGEFVTRFIQRAGGASRDAQRVEVPFTQVAPPPEQVWSGDTTEELRVPVGRAGATKLQWLELGRDTRQHGLVAGKTGSGKSTLFHVLVTNLALWHAPDQVEFYLIDFKKGVEFKCYAAHRLPHARVVAIESDREFGLSVLQRVDDELRRRGDLFRGVGAQNLSAYRRAAGVEPLPRTLLIIDEFQEFFVEDDKVAQTASVLLDRIVRQGRAFGIHVLLGSQTLGGAYTVARATLGQMVVRVALQCNETDACLIMDDDNPAPRLLSRPGAGIYNDAAGRIEGNSPFQAVWLDDSTRDAHLRQIRARADQAGGAWPAPIVFEGNAPADVRENPHLAEWLEKGALRAAGTGAQAPRLWLGAPNSIKGPTEVVFQRQSGNHLLVVGQNDEAVLAMLGIGVISLAAQLPAAGVRLVVFDTSPPGSPEREFLERIARRVPHPIQWVRGGELAGALARLVAELDRRPAASAPEAPPIFVFVPGAQKFGRLRPEDEFSFGDSAEAAAKPSALFQRLVSEGASQGLHLLVTFDTGANAQRFLGRKGLAEFAARVLFQMSANDSALLMDSVRASALGLHRALLFNEQEGHTEIFRPYARPANEWLDQAADRLNRRTSAGAQG